MKALIVSVLGILLLPKTAWAQRAIAPDETLGPERSRVITVPGFPIEEIQGGAQRGQNLFHSFREFNISSGRGAYFFIPNGVVRNVLTRVTGDSRSDIQGTIGTVSPGGVRVPNVNLFLINPNGITFGENASLDVGASFFATTASGVQLGDGVFSATQPEQPIDVLTVDPSAFLFGSATPGKIEVRSRATQTVLGRRLSNRTASGLRVPNGETLLILGGDVAINGGLLLALGGRVEVGAVAGAGEVKLAEGKRLSIPTMLPRADVAFTNPAGVDVSLNRGGDISIAARNITLSGSLVRTGIEFGLGAEGNRSGDIRLDATGEVKLTQESRIENNVNRNAIGNSGNIVIGANSLVLTNGSQLVAITRSKGNAGNVLITAGNRVQFQGRSTDGELASAAFSSVEPDGEGQGGNVVITSPVLEVLDGAGLVARTSGTGDAGNILITASERVLFQGRSTGGESVSNALSIVASGGEGQGGNVVIISPVLEVLDGAQLAASTAGKGNAGNVIITASNRVRFQERGTGGESVSAAFSSVEPDGEGQGGNVVITSPVLEVIDGSQLIADTRGKGNAGNVQITARDQVLFQGTSVDKRFRSSANSSVELGGEGQGGKVEITTSVLKLLDGAALITSTFGTGNAGNIQITVSDRVLLQGRSKSGQFVSAVLNSVESSGVGNGGKVEITVPVLELLDGAQLAAGTRGKGDAGNVQITASNRVILDGFNPVTGRSSGILINNGTPRTRGIGTGSGGDVILTTPQLTLSNGAVIDARTVNDKRGGDITLNLSQLALFNGGQILTTSDGSGTAGTLNLTATDQVLISGIDPTYTNRFAQFRTAVAPINANSGIYARANSTGAAGNLNLTTTRLTLDQQGRIDTQSATVNGGNINLTIPGLLLLRNNSQISVNAGTADSKAPGKGGNIDINARFIIGIPQENSDITANASNDQGGNVKINTQGIFGLKVQPQPTSSSDITASSEGGPTGNITLTTPNNSAIQNNLSQLSTDNINPEQLIAKTCIVRQNDVQGRFAITGNTNLPNSPGTIAPSTYATATIQTTKTTAKSDRPWKLGDPIIEPTGFYRLADDRLVLGRECAANSTPTP
jgi:filamentous hemagglutinin family protein